ncbi:CDP-glycerol glycerophosphotransferase (TagB/SpsB family) [Scopulibacillus darangshiensis]|uniref:CDP-glycerol glycerophosphotransferase (TagB/SpsB family) n=1 Tax=Scopulibacillus darangshiensis TaxID=442528 RepID=A0A4R2N8M7_9BACL|nr:CDP-glycerol glycerophosphotransferase family protein [Scopulibacillus darangshiensis]TCP17235.1 CDP-glycerol glycerophosphotransferase (TagB/SpsB family) [Scopulibacillus darangshiensis]
MYIDISVIIPVYNVEMFINEALDSVANQKFKGTVEIIVIDDCSTDNTLDLVKDFQKNHSELSMKVLKQETNKKQGAARNRGIRESIGKYIFFLDGDDFLDPNAFQKMYEKGEDLNCDFVLCDWAYYYQDNRIKYVNNDLFLFKDILKGKACEDLYQATTYFTVNKLYRRDFLLKNNIGYGEGYIYEDFEFYVKVAQHATAIGIIQNPYYKVRVNEYSTTKSDTKSTTHIVSYLKAVENSIVDFNPRADASYYHLFKHLIQKTLFYSETRAPFGYKKRTLKKVLTILNNKNKNYFVPLNIIPLNHLYFRRRYVQNEKINSILFVNWLQSKGKLVKLFRFAQRNKQKVINSKLVKSFKETDYYKKKKKREFRESINTYFKRPINNNTILFLGFDYRYVGNSKYLFDYLKENGSHLNIYFVTKNKNVPVEYRVTPRSLKFYEVLAKSKIVFAESWVPLDFRKREESVWIQLWHGTPFKKLLFDSHETFISRYNRNHKRQKQNDISRWDYVLADSSEGKEKLSSAFDINSQRILNYGYTRVKWLIDNKENVGLKTEIREQLRIPNDKRIILYVPTWRDYNFKQKNPNLSYLLDLQKFGAELQDDYVIINKQHSMGNFKIDGDFVVTPNESIEVQKLILISDLIISDYSSIIFDAMAIGVPFYLYINDYEKYKDARGVYEDMDRILSAFYVDNIEDLVEKVQSIMYNYPAENYDLAKGLYSNSQFNNSYEDIVDKIYEIQNKKRAVDGHAPKVFI